MRVTESMGPAWETMKRLLFRPFNLGTWFTFGFVFFLQDCVEGGGGGNFPTPGGGSGGSSHHNGSDDAIGDVLQRTLSSVSSLGSHGRPGLGGIGVTEIVLVAVVALVVMIPIIFLMMWLGARGQAMAIRSVAFGRAEVGEAWKATQRTGNALFKFHAAVSGLSLLLLLPALGLGAAVALPAIQSHESLDTILLPLIGIGVFAVVCLVPMMIVSALGRNFVAPIMLRHEIGAREGWQRFWAVGKSHVGGIFLFFVLKIACGAVAGIVGIIASVATCCLGFLPVVHQALMAPWYVFERAWTLEILASMSPDFDLRCQPDVPQPPQGWAPPGGPFTPYGGGGPYGGPSSPYSPPAGGYGGGNPYGGPGGGNPYG